MHIVTVENMNNQTTVFLLEMIQIILSHTSNWHGTQGWLYNSSLMIDCVGFVDLDMV